MKKNTLILYTANIILLLAFVIAEPSCKPDEPTITENNARILTSGLWKINNVKIDGVDKSGLFAGLTLEFTKDTYTTTNGSPIWKPSGTWRFMDSTGTLIDREGLPVTVVAISNSELILSLLWDKTTFSGRINSIAGDHRFVFTK